MCSICVLRLSLDTLFTILLTIFFSIILIICCCFFGDILKRDLLFQWSGTVASRLLCWRWLAYMQITNVFVIFCMFFSLSCSLQLLLLLIFMSLSLPVVYLSYTFERKEKTVQELFISKRQRQKKIFVFEKICCVHVLDNFGILSNNNKNRGIVRDTEFGGVSNK